ncbi:MAG: hypothetical protein ACFCVF_09990 [Kineosporiaceae bacterium]
MAIDALAAGESRSRAEVLRTAVGEFLRCRRDAEIDAKLSAGYGRVPVGSRESAFADVSVEGVRLADLDW